MTISELNNLFEQAKTQPWAQNLTFEQFAGLGAQATGDPELARIAQAGPIENTVRGWNQGLTEWVNSGPVDEFLGKHVGNLAEAVGVDRATGESVGASLPREVVNLLPMLIPGGAPVRIAGAIGSAALSGVNTYDQTGSPWQAGISALAPTVVGKAMNAGGNAVLNAAAKSPMFQRLGVTGVKSLTPRLTTVGTRGQIVPLGSQIQDDIVSGFANKATRYAGGQAAGQAAGLGLDVLAQGPEAVFNENYLFSNLVGNLAFAPLDAGDFIGTRVVNSRDIAPNKPVAERTPLEQRAFDFQALINSLDPAQQAQAKKAAGLDIAQQFLNERSLAGLEETYNNKRSQASSDLEAFWNANRAQNPNLPDFTSAVTNPDSISFELFPEAKGKLEDYKALVKRLNGEENAKWNQALVKPNLQSLQKVAIDDLRLPDTLLQKPVAERTLKDYEDVLVDKVSDRGVKALYAMHKMAAGEDYDPRVTGVVTELGKMLRGEPTKFANDRSFVAMSMWALGAKPRAEKMVMQGVEKKVKEGATTKEAVSKETQKDAVKLVKKVRGKDKQKRKVNEQVSLRAEEMEGLVQQAGLAVDGGKATPEQKFLVDAYTYASEQSGGDPVLMRKFMSFLGQIAPNGKSLEEKLKMFKTGVQTSKGRAILAQARDTKVAEAPVDENVSAVRAVVEEDEIDQGGLLAMDEEGDLTEVDNSQEPDGEVVVDEMIDEVEDGEKVPSTKELTDKAIEQEMLRLVQSNLNMGPREAKMWLENVDVKKQKALEEVAKNNLLKYARDNSDPNVPQFGLQNVMSFDKWAETLLADQGFTPQEIPGLKEHFAKVIEMFYSPEVKYGFLDEFPMESKLAKGYIGVVGPNGLRWRQGELNDMVHSDTPDIAPRLGETKFRYRDDTETLYRWSYMTPEEEAIIRDKLKKAGKDVKAVKLITQQNISEAHGIEGIRPDSFVKSLKEQLSELKTAYMQGKLTEDEWKGHRTRLENSINNSAFGTEPGETVKWAASNKLTTESPVITFASRNGDSIRLEFDALKAKPTVEMLKEAFPGASIEEMSPDVVSGTKGNVVFKLNVLDNKGRMSSQEAERLYTKNFGTNQAIRGQTEFQRLGTLNERFQVGQLMLGQTDLTTLENPINKAQGSRVYAGAIERLRQVFLNPNVSKGLSPTQKINQTTSLLAHENSHILLDKARKGKFGDEAQRIVTDMDNWVQSADPQEVEVVVDTMADVFLNGETRRLPGVEDVVKNLRDNYGKMDKDEVLANMYGIWATGLHQVKEPGRFYTFLPKVVRDVFDWISEKLQGVVKAAQVYVKFGGDASKVAKVQQVRDVFAAVRKGARKAEANLGELAELANLNQADAVDLAEMVFARGEYGSSGKLKETIEKNLDNWILRGASLAQTYKGLEDPYIAMVDTIPRINDLTAQAYAGLGWGDYSYTGLDVKKNTGPARIRDSEALRKVASKVNVEMQKANELVVETQPDGTIVFNLEKLSPELRAEVKQFSQEAQRVMAEYFINRSQKTMPIVHGTIVKSEWDKQEANLHRTLLAYDSFKEDFKGAKEFSKELMQALRQGDMVKVAEMQARLPDQVEAPKVVKVAEMMAQNIKELEADYKANPAFGSLKRFQPIKQKWTKGTEVRNMQARTAKDAERMAKELEEQGFTPGIPRIMDNKPTDEWVLEGASKKRLRDQEQRLKDALDALGIDEDVKSELKKDMDFVGMLEADEAGRSVFSTKVKRNFAPGVDELDVLEQDLQFVQKAISGSQKAALDAKVRVSMLNPELDEHYDAKQTFLQNYENFKTPNEAWLNKLSKANAAWFIGFNLPGHIAELMQPVMTHFAEMRNLGLRAGDSLKILGGATKDVAAFYKRNWKKFVKGESVHLWDDWKDPQEKDMLFDMKHVINANPLNYAFDEIGFKQQQLVEMTEGGKKKSLAELAASPATAYGNWGLKFYNLFTRHNAVMGLVGGYRALRKAGFSHEEAKEKVRLYETVVNKSGGRADRQAAPFKGNALLGHLFYGLQGYTTGWFSQMLTYARHGFDGKQYARFRDNPQARKNARNAFWTMLGAQLGAAGLMGMPFVSALISLYEEAADDDVRGKVYEALESVTGDPLIAQAASHGVASAVAEKLGIPADLHGRFAIGGFLGFNAYDGFSAASLLGPTAGMVNSLWNMGSKFAQEEDVRAALASGGPTGIKNIAKALDENLPASGESAFNTALGFRSPQERKEREFTRIVEKRNEKAARDLAQAARRIQDALPRGKDVVQRVTLEEAKKLLTEGADNKELKEILGRLGSKVRQFEEQRTLPADLKSQDSFQGKADALNLARSMGVQLPASQLMQREQLRQGVYQMMGLPYRSRMLQAMREER